MNSYVSRRSGQVPLQQHTLLATRLHTIGTCAVDSLLLELATWPKPGLVSYMDSGSHTDMDAALFERSARAIAPYFFLLAVAGARGCEMSHLRVVGLEAEAAMFEATKGVNTHRGSIFGLGLLCAAAGARTAGRVEATMPLGAVVATLWGHSILDGPVLLHSHGSRARLRFGAGGARMQASRGFPGIYEIGLPAMQRAARHRPGNFEAARVEACFALIAALEDTNLLHRGGLHGLRFAQRQARQFLDAGGVATGGWITRARTVHENFVARRLSPGGSADLLAFTLFVDAQEGCQ
ncbi:triphosphoribosyl-dephospho-CoA synthase MdcB [Povalibacter sp.]|uniref:triphosphoribosyl-dephospho-CoA synthase MdcB n=1 Tax=Povalibacter sp. TaxID=1962978 RepID=UPI002F3F7696